MTRAYLGIGSNIGDKEANCRKAIDLISGVEGLNVLDRSSLYVTAPVGGPPQDDFLNGVIGIETDLSAYDLLRELKHIEKGMGRGEADERDLPRIIDIDILFYGDTVEESASLVLPHPRMHERTFVLRGLAEIAPEAVHPVLRKTAGELYSELNGK